MKVLDVEGRLREIIQSLDGVRLDLLLHSADDLRNLIAHAA
jgi:hypothetical protein